ncbi:Outer membrane scaffolding protein for murein synthesis, MipA/OmpV family [Arsukibacterium tuosuense]|uniref:Outer membrane scaffolding protein for murein synthesis, MipA/OmpV family n=1 Tax=Arsukibacterium tuosuense TaxID=1323745 RepID=A0A285I146_9GAMM|nr:MipA/OmpV family protein [Arsukibacterium tuosuense]SNY41678.1 Outer membrane scaffolding protein for murein synthesis, MipA/OmpV family [Arsukibacterium tuosuense]
MVKPIKKLQLVGTVLVAGVFAAVVKAEPATELPLWEAGIIGLSIEQLAYPGSSEQVQRNFVLPYLIYRGDFLRADRDNVGLRAYKSDTLELDVGFAAALGSSESDIPQRDGMPELGTLVEAGPRLRWTISDNIWGSRLRLDLPVRAVFDIEEGMRYSGVSFEPALFADVTTAAELSYTFGVSALFGSEKLTDRFYQVAGQYANAGRPEFDAQPGLIALRVSGAISKKFSSKWRGFGFARYETVTMARNRRSPLVVDNGGWSVGIGVTYIWATSAQTVTGW